MPANRSGLLAFLSLYMAARVAIPAAASQLEIRMVIANEVVCRAEPSLSAPVVRGYVVGDRIGTRGAVKAEGATWYADQLRASGARPACWIHGSLTAPYDSGNPEPALLTVADHVLARTDAVPFEDYVAAENLLLRTVTGPHSEETVIASSARLQLRRMQIVQRAIADRALIRQGVSRAPLKAAWLFAHRDLIWYFEPGGRWAMRPETFWALFEQRRSEPWAEEIAWAAAETRVFTDECDEGCVLDAIYRTYARYWMNYPKGTFVDDALAQAVERARYAAQLGCRDGASDRLQQALAQIRTSLEEVVAPGRQPLVELLDEIERRCRSLTGASGAGGRRR